MTNLSDWHSMILPDALRLEGVDGYKGIVFRMPAGTKYEGYTFWYTKKLLTRLFSHDWEMVYGTNFVFHLKCYENVESEDRKLVSELEVSASDFEKIMHENVNG